MLLSELKDRFKRAAPIFAEYICHTYYIACHTVLTTNGFKIPSEKEVENIILSLVDGLKEETSSASSGGIILEIERDELDNEIIDGTIGYNQSLFTLLNEELC